MVESLGKTVSDSVKFGILKCLRRFSKSPLIAATVSHQISILFRVWADNYDKDIVIFSCTEVLSNILDNEACAKMAVQVEIFFLFNAFERIQSPLSKTYWESLQKMCIDKLINKGGMRF